MKKEQNVFVNLASVVLGILLVVVVIFVLLAKEHLVFLVPLAWAFVVLGIVIAFFQYLAVKKK